MPSGLPWHDDGVEAGDGDAQGVFKALDLACLIEDLPTANNLLSRWVQQYQGRRLMSRRCVPLRARRAVSADSRPSMRIDGVTEAGSASSLGFRPTILQIRRALL